MVFSSQHSCMDTNTQNRHPTAPASLVIRDTDALDGIEARLVAQVNCRILTPYVGRLFRREFNWLSRKMFLRGRSDDKFRKTSIRMIDEIAAEVTMLEADIAHLDRWQDRPLSGHDIVVRIVDVAASRLMVQFRRLDATAAILYRAQIYGMVVSTPERWEYMKPAMQSVSRLTNHCLGAIDADRVATSAAALQFGD